LDGGATWTQTPNGLRDLFPGGGDSDVAVDSMDGTVYYADLWLGSSTVSVSHDQGETWIASPLDGVVVEDRQWLATPGSGRVYLATHQIPSGIVVSKSLTGGIGYVFSSVAASVADQTGCICPSGNIIAEAGAAGLGLGLANGLNDRVGVIYSTSTGGVKFAQSVNGALTFGSFVVSQVSTADTTRNFPVVANGGNSHLVAIWLELIGNSTRVQFSDSVNWGATWTAPRTLVATGTSVYPWVYARGGKVAVSLYHTTAEGTPDRVPESAQWFETYLESTNGGATFSAPQIVDPAPVKSGPICTEGASCTEDPGTFGLSKCRYRQRKSFTADLDAVHQQRQRHRNPIRPAELARS